MARRDLPDGEVTLVFTDIEGSTKFLHAVGLAAYADALARHRRIVRRVIATEGGVEVDNQGDAFFLAFRSPAGAVRAAVAVTAAHVAEPIRLRIGIHTGRPHRAEEGYLGADVHLAARIAAAANGGQIVLSGATRALLDATFEVADLGVHRLKDIPGQVTLHQVGRATFPAVHTLGVARAEGPSG